jgi:hypothetical protein
VQWVLLTDFQELRLFDVIGVEVLGNIYEQYLGFVPRLTEKRVK